jgi:hypothetical protein
MGLKLKERLVGACLQVHTILDKIIYLQGECRWKEVYWIYIFHAGSCFQIQRGKPCCTLSYLVGLWPSCHHIICTLCYLVGLWPSCQHIICLNVVLNHHWWELRYFLVTMKWNLSNYPHLLCHLQTVIVWWCSPKKLC